MSSETQDVGTRPALNVDESYHWLHSERATQASIAQWLGGYWHLIGESTPITPRELQRRGWEYLGPCMGRPYSRYIDY